MPGVLEIVTGESRQIGITVATTTAMITIMSDSTGIASVAESAERFELEVQEGVSNSTQINVSGGNVGINDGNDYRGGGRLYQRDGERRACG